MAKAEQQEVRSKARGMADQSKQQTQQALSGGGAFGDKGLTGEQAASRQARTDTLGNVNSFINTAKDFSSTGGYDPNQLQKIRSGYEGFANTGGFTPQDEATYRRNATAGVPAAFDVMKREAMRRRSLTGGLGPGGDLAQMAREEGETAARANTAAESNLAEMKRQGKLSGLSGLGGTEQSVAGHKLAGAQLGGSLASSLYNSQTGEISDQGHQILQMLGIDSSNQAEAMSALQSMANTPGVLDRIMQIGGMAAGALGGMTGAGMFGGLMKKLPGMGGNGPAGAAPVMGGGWGGYG